MNEELVAIRQLHEQVVNRAYELGRFDHGDGKPREAVPIDFCDTCRRAWAEGWQDEQKGKS